MLKPLPVSSKLFANPQRDPQFAVKIKNKQGGEVAAADPRATRALVSLMDMYAVLGGAACHFGGPAAVAELMSAAHAFMFCKAKEAGKDWTELFHFVNDIGHAENGLYALKANYELAGLDLDALKEFRSIESKLTGHGEVHLFPEAVFLSNGPLGSAFPQSQGLAIGEKLSQKNRCVFSVISDGACMEGEAKEAFAAIPGLAAAKKLSPYITIISDNNTKLTGRIDKDAFSMKPTFDSLPCLGWKVIVLKNAHDLQACYAAIEEAYDFAIAHPQTPVAIHAHTIKGYGTKKTAESESGGHGFPLKKVAELPDFLREIYNSEDYPAAFQSLVDDLIQKEAEIKRKSSEKPADAGEKIQVGVAKALQRAKKAGWPLLSITSDLPGSTGVASFRKEFPESSIDVGVAESNMISTAAGLSKLGYVPVVDTFAQFGVTKGALPITMANLSEAPMICIFSHTGFQDAADGASHQALSYLAMTTSIPHSEVYQLSSSEEAEALVYAAIEKFVTMRDRHQIPPTFVFFLGRENFPKALPNLTEYKLKKAQVCFDNTSEFKQSVCLVTAGSLLEQSYPVAELLRQKQIGCYILNHSCANVIDDEALLKGLQKTNGNLVIFEDHQIIGGLGQMIGNEILKWGQDLPKVSYLQLGVEGEFGQSAYSSMDLYQKHGLSPERIVAKIFEMSWS